MKQIVRRVIDKKGKVSLIEYPVPEYNDDQILVQNFYSLISTGTELSTLSKTPIELVKQTISDPWMRNAVKQTVFSAGLIQTANRVWLEMIKPREIGYSGSGRVLAVGKNIEGIQVGDHVAYASTGHAEVVAPYKNHIVSVSKGIPLRHTAFVTVGGIAMQALRRGEIQFGEIIVVYGLGLVGQLCAMIAKSAGCVVIGIDINNERNEIAKKNGIDYVLNPNDVDIQRKISDLTNKQGVDATFMCASSKSSDIVNSSMEITRKQGRVVIVGYVGLSIHPKNFLLKEIDLRYSRAYGPGSYHNAYEKGRIDYPYGYVRWTERRNLEEVIRLIAEERLNLESLIGGVFSLEETQEAFDNLAKRKMSGIAALIRYSQKDEIELKRTISYNRQGKSQGELGLSIVGAGNHAMATYLPMIHSCKGVKLQGLGGASGKNAVAVSNRYKAQYVTTSLEEILSDKQTDGVIICSNHNNHFDHLRQAILNGTKSVLIEKPMVTTFDDLKSITQLIKAHPLPVSLGVNRRYSSMIKKTKEILNGQVDHVSYHVTVPLIPNDHWSVDEVQGGGRLIAESEHFIDLCNYLIGQEVKYVFAQILGPKPDMLRQLCNYCITIQYESSSATIVFIESGSPNHPREKITIMSKGQIAILEDFALLTYYGKKNGKKGGKKSDMGHKSQLDAFVASLRGEPSDLITWDEAFTATATMLAAEESIRSGSRIDMTDFRDEILSS